VARRGIPLDPFVYFEQPCLGCLVPTTPAHTMRWDEKASLLRAHVRCPKIGAFKRRKGMIGVTHSEEHAPLRELPLMKLVASS
jgi:hypothetical protein